MVKRDFTGWAEAALLDFFGREELAAPSSVGVSRQAW